MFTYLNSWDSGRVEPHLLRPRAQALAALLAYVPDGTKAVVLAMPRMRHEVISAVLASLRAGERAELFVVDFADKEDLSKVRPTGRAVLFAQGASPFVEYHSDLLIDLRNDNDWIVKNRYGRVGPLVGGRL